MKKSLRVILPVIGTLVVLWVLLSAVDVRAVYNTLRTSDMLLVVIAAAVLFSAHPFMALRWYRVLVLLGYQPSFKEVFQAYLANLPITKLTPTYSGDFLRAVYLKEKIPLAIGTGAIFLETLIDISVLALSVVLGTLSTGEYRGAFIAGVLIISFVVLSILLSTSRASDILGRYPTAKNFFLATALMKKNLTALPTLALLSFFGWMGTIFFLKIIFLALGSDVPLATILLLQPLAVFAALLPITVSGVGVRESAMVVLYGGFIGAPVVMAAGLAYSFFTVIVFPIFCLPITFLTLKRGTTERR